LRRKARFVRGIMSDAIWLRRATLDDAGQLWEWRNEADTRAASFNQEPITYEDHLCWFGERLKDPQVRIFVVVDADHRDIGYARLHLAGDTAEIDVSLDKSRRGKGLGSEVIRGVADYAVRYLKVRRVVARIRPENTRSIAAFKSAAFAVSDGLAEAGTDCVQMVYELNNGQSFLTGDTRKL